MANKNFSLRQLQQANLYVQLGYMKHGHNPRLRMRSRHQVQRLLRTLNASLV